MATRRPARQAGRAPWQAYRGLRGSPFPWGSPNRAARCRGFVPHDGPIAGRRGARLACPTSRISPWRTSPIGSGRFSGWGVGNLGARWVEIRARTDADTHGDVAQVDAPEWEGTVAAAGGAPVARTVPPYRGSERVPIAPTQAPRTGERMGAPRWPPGSRLPPRRNERRSPSHRSPPRYTQRGMGTFPCRAGSSRKWSEPRGTGAGRGKGATGAAGVGMHADRDRHALLEGRLRGFGTFSRRPPGRRARGRAAGRHRSGRSDRRRTARGGDFITVSGGGLGGRP